MRRHSPSLLLSSALVAALAAGCGGGSTGSGTVASGTSTAATATTTTATTPTTATTRTATTPATPAARAAAVLSSQANTPPKRRFAAAPISSAAASQLAKGRTIVVPVVVGGPGKISAFGQAQLANGRIEHVAEAAPKVVHGAGTVTLQLRLKPVALQQLAAGKRMVMYVAVRFSKGEVIDRLTVPLNP